jgi:adenylosuccinate synthase
MSEYLTDVSDEVNKALEGEKKVLVEGTQGFGLSIYHSDHYPKTTSRDTTAAGFLSEVGVSPRLVTEIVVVFRTFPIRVAGVQAGPLKDEITWEQIQRESGYPHPIEERTTVTNKVRRVARFDWDLVKQAIQINRPTRLALNGLDYIDFSNRAKTDWSQLSQRARQFVHRLEENIEAPVFFLGTGPALQEKILTHGTPHENFHQFGSSRNIEERSSMTKIA